MKIHSLTVGPIGYATRIRQTPGELDNSPPQELGQEKENHHSQDQPQQKAEEESPSPQSESLDEAVDAFRAEQQVQANGLSASVTGVGPGLKVVLKDEGGSIVRQLTGDEFLRLRQAAFRNGQIPGKILDQKL